MAFELKLNVSKVLLLDTPFKPELLENNQAVIAEIEGKSVLIFNVNTDDILQQIKEQS